MKYEKDYDDVEYGTFGTIKSHGCVPTSMAMVISSFRDVKIAPVETISFACPNGFCTKKGRI